MPKECIVEGSVRIFDEKVRNTWIKIEKLNNCKATLEYHRKINSVVNGKL